MFRLADYLEQHGHTTRRHLCPPASFWHAAHTHLTHPHGLNNLTGAAENRHRLQWAHHLRQRAADRGSTEAMHRLAEMREVAGAGRCRSPLSAGCRPRQHHALVRLPLLRERARDRARAETLARQAADRADPGARIRLPLLRERERDGGTNSDNAWAQQIFEELWLYGLDPDGTPTLSWQP
ncbi:hypothetical protein [Streptomyces sp. Root369]|uniref:hypothetical protein n=1 Tax=Streptomyces sp. Root369 TaxID=1736523 RepID=UPI0007093A37|nr:hypothetical protein [Streptomyces sp. Root369]KQW00037.1 hypothetical protein ASD08_47090 [Streptomyces sp. Root369]